MPKLFVYRIVTDNNVAPHVTNNYLTLTLCKPGIRKAAKPGDYVLALVALQHAKLTGKGPDRYFKAAYLFKIDEVVPLKAYTSWCETHAPDKICSLDQFDGNCQYDEMGQQTVPWPHPPAHAKRDLSGKFSLTSKFFAAWTSKSPYTLSSVELEQIGLEEEGQIKTATRNYFTSPLSPEQQVALDKIIRAAGPQVSKPACSTRKNCSKRGGLRQSRSRSRHM
jgi:hypothetical protein